MTPDLSVIIPVFNRGELIRYTLESVRRASVGLNVETIIVDDGSEPPVKESLARLGFTSSLLIRQPNQGLLFARLAGLARATGRNVLFLDSDDLVSAEKFSLQLAAMDRAAADLSYCDTAHCEIGGEFDQLAPKADAPNRATTDATEFCIVIQPPPHSPIFRTTWLRRAVNSAVIPASPLYNSVAEIWFYHNAALLPGKAVHVPGPHAIVGVHPGARLTNHWEKLAVASLGMMEAFARHCPATAETQHVRHLVGQKAFHSWRWLPREFSPEFCARELAVWRRLDRGRVKGGGPVFQLLSLVLGAVRAARLLQTRLNGDYESCRTMSDAEFEKILRALPPP